MAQIIPIITDADHKASRWDISVINAMRLIAAKTRCKVQVCSCESKDLVWEGLPDVVIVTNGTMYFLNNTISRLLRMNKRIILMGFNTDVYGPGISCVSSSHHYETIQMLAYYYGHGYDKIALVGLQKDSVNDMARYRAALAYSPTEGRAVREDAFFFWEGSPDACLAAFADRAHDFDAAVCPNGPFAICLLNYCKKRGIRVPDDIMISTFSNMIINRLTRPSITSMILDYRAISTHLLYAWQFLTAHHDSNVTTWLWVPSELIIGESTAALPERFFSPSLPLPVASEPSDFDENQFYTNPDFLRLIRLEECLSVGDAIDKKILSCIFSGIPHESISQRLYLSMSSIRYRINKIYKSAGVASQAELLATYKKYIGEGNPFPDAEIFDSANTRPPQKNPKH